MNSWLCLGIWITEWGTIFLISNQKIRRTTSRDVTVSVYWSSMPLISVFKVGIGDGRDQSGPVENFLLVNRNFLLKVSMCFFLKKMSIEVFLFRKLNTFYWCRRVFPWEKIHQTTLFSQNSSLYINK
jgi:hypothetical protein